MPKALTKQAPSTTPKTVPSKRCFEVDQAAPSDDCITMIAEIAAQYDSGIPISSASP